MPFPDLPPPAAPTASVESAVQAALDKHDLHLLEIVYYVAGGITALFSCFFLLHFTMFLVFGLNPQFFNQHGHNQNPPPAGFFLIFAAFIGVIILLGWTLGALQIYVGRCLKFRRHALLIQIVGGLECVFIPWGTLLGVMTFKVMQRPSIAAQFTKSL